MPETEAPVQDKMMDLWRAISKGIGDVLKRDDRNATMVVLNYSDWYDMLVTSAARAVTSTNGKKEILGLTVYLSSDVEIGKPVVA